MEIVNSQQMQRWLAVGVLIALVLIVSMVVIVPLVSKGLELHDTKNDLVFRLQQYERILSTKDAVSAGIAKIKLVHDQQGYFNSQKTDALASAETQEFIKKASVYCLIDLLRQQSLF